MRKHKTAIAFVAAIVAVIGWYLFRPERLFINKTVNETLNVTQANTDGLGSAVAVESGKFHGVAHNGGGTATIYRLAGGKRVLRFTDFETSNGPDVQVYLVAAPDATDSDTVKKAGFVHLGPLKGNRGDQNYDIASDVDLNKYRAATVWCRRFGVNFGTAPLAAQASMARAQ
jgi:Electron transfer DM13